MPTPMYHIFCVTRNNDHILCNLFIKMKVYWLQNNTYFKQMKPTYLNFFCFIFWDLTLYYVMYTWNQIELKFQNQCSITVLMADGTQSFSIYV